MSKGLEALERISNHIEVSFDYSSDEDLSIIKKELKEGEKAKQATTVIFRMFIEGVDINRVLFEVSVRDSFEEFKMVYSNAIKEEYDLLKEVIL